MLLELFSVLRPQRLKYPMNFGEWELHRELQERREPMEPLARLEQQEHLEQVRLDVCYQDADVKIIGAGSGLDSAQSGPTHQPTEDISMMRSLPNMRVACPADPLEAAALPKILCASSKPFYVKLGRGKEPTLHAQMPGMEIGGMLPLYSTV